MSIVYNTELLNKFSKIVNAQQVKASEGVDVTSMINAGASKILDSMKLEDSNSQAAQKVSKPDGLTVKDITSLDNFIDYLKEKSKPYVSSTPKEGFEKFKNDYISPHGLATEILQLKNWASKKGENIRSFVNNIAKSFKDAFPAQDRSNIINPNDPIFAQTDNIPDVYKKLTASSFSSNDAINNTLDFLSTATNKSREWIINMFILSAKGVKTYGNNPDITPAQKYFADQILNYAKSVQLSNNTAPENTSNQNQSSQVSEKSQGLFLQKLNNIISIIPKLIDGNNIYLGNIEILINNVKSLSNSSSTLSTLSPALYAVKSTLLGDPDFVQITLSGIKSSANSSSSVNVVAGYILNLIDSLAGVLSSLRNSFGNEYRNLDPIVMSFAAKAQFAKRQLEDVQRVAKTTK